MDTKLLLLTHITLVNHWGRYKPPHAFLPSVYVLLTPRNRRKRDKACRWLPSHSDPISLLVPCRSLPTISSLAIWQSSQVSNSSSTYQIAVHHTRIAAGHTTSSCNSVQRSQVASCYEFKLHTSGESHVDAKRIQATRSSKYNTFIWGFTPPSIHYDKTRPSMGSNPSPQVGLVSLMNPVRQKVAIYMDASEWMVRKRWLHGPDIAPKTSIEMRRYLLSQSGGVHVGVNGYYHVW